MGDDQGSAFDFSDWKDETKEEDTNKNNVIILKSSPRGKVLPPRKPSSPMKDTKTKKSNNEQENVILPKKVMRYTCQMAAKDLPPSQRTRKHVPWNSVLI